MAERQTRFGSDPLTELQREQEYGIGGVSPGMAITPTQRGDTAINIFGGTITAQRVAVARDITRIMARMQQLAAVGGEAWVYRWQVNNRATGSKDTIEGGTIKLANDLAREWGNCQVDIRVVDEGAHWMFYGRFVDLETGYALTRPYQQRKSQNTGMKDQQRALDMVMQIGASKCIRNVVLNALQTMTDYCLDLADNSVLERVKKNPEAARNWILKELEKLNVDVKRVERVAGYKADKFTVPVMAGLFAQIRSVIDGMILADDIWPTDETLAERKAAGEYDETKDKSRQQTNAEATNKEGGGEPKKEDPPPVKEPDEAAGDGGQKREPPKEDEPLYVVKNEKGVVIGTLRTAPELGSEFPYNDVQVRAVEVSVEGAERVVVVRVVPPPTAADKAAAAAKRASTPAADKKGAAKKNLFDDET
jgi:hypothetical protein